MELTKLQLANIIRAQVLAAMDAAATAHNKVHPDKIRIEVKEQIHQREHNMNVGVTELILFTNGVPEVWVRKTYGFEHRVQTHDKGEWLLTIWKSILQDMAATSIVAKFVSKQAKQELEN